MPKKGMDELALHDGIAFGGPADLTFADCMLASDLSIVRKARLD